MGTSPCCSQCGAGVYDSHQDENSDNFVLDIEAESAALLAKDEVLSQRFYHVTHQADWLSWLEEGSVPLVHIGTKRSAGERGDCLASYSVKDLYLYEVTLPPDTVIADDVLEDENDWPLSVEKLAHWYKLPPVNAMRYVNFFEAPGSISLLVDPRKIDIVSREIFPVV